MSAVKAVRGLSWGHAAVGNATWTGARLSDVLRAAGYDERSAKGKHVCVSGGGPLVVRLVCVRRRAGGSVGVHYHYHYPWCPHHYRTYVRRSADRLCSYYWTRGF